MTSDEWKQAIDFLVFASLVFAGGYCLLQVARKIRHEYHNWKANVRLKKFMGQPHQ